MHRVTRNNINVNKLNLKQNARGARWLSSRVSDCGARGLRFHIYICRVVSLSKTLYSPKVLVIPRKRCPRPDMTEQLLTGTLSLKTNKQTKEMFLKQNMLHPLFCITSPLMSGGSSSVTINLYHMTSLLFFG